MMLEINYIDWNNALSILSKAFETGLFVLIIGPKGTGKTTLVRKFASQMKKELYSVNFSLRTRESHLIGTKTLEKGQVNFVEGILVRSMRDGNMLYLDELNAAEAWFVIATINPLSHVGTKELPPQLLSRFPVRLKLEYPPEDIELQIISQHTSIESSNLDEVKRSIKLAKSLREAAALEELYYSPSLRETIAFAKLIGNGIGSRQAAEIVYANVYDQWGEVEYQKVMDMITSIFDG